MKKDRREAIRSFNNDAGMRVLIANQGAGGIGIKSRVKRHTLSTTHGDLSLEMIYNLLQETIDEALKSTTR